MTRHLAWAAALLLSTAAAAQTPSPATTPPTPATPPSSRTAVPEMAPGAGASPTGNTTSADVSAADKKFVEKAASAGMAEVQAAQLAQQKSQDQKVKDFAQQMTTDHTANNQQLTKLAQQKGLTPQAALDDRDQKEIDKLQGLDGKKFDRVYMKGQIHGHEAMLKLLQQESKSTKDTDLKAFADQTIPVVQKHLDMAKSGV